MDFPRSKFNGQGIVRDTNGRTTLTKATLLLPSIKSTAPPPSNFVAGVGGSIYYDVVTERIYYDDGKKIIPVGFQAPGTSESYNIVKDGDISIPPITQVDLTGWTTSGSPTYHTLPEWNLTTGVYTASSSQSITVNVNIAWSAGVSNLGNRYMGIQYQPASLTGWITIKGVSTQADPNLFIETTQECTTTAKLNIGDQLKIVVYHDAPLPLTINGSDPLKSSLGGIKIYNE